MVSDRGQRRSGREGRSNILRIPQLIMIRHAGIQEQISILARLLDHARVQGVSLGKGLPAEFVSVDEAGDEGV